LPKNGDRPRLDDALLPTAFDVSTHRRVALAIDDHQERVDAGSIYCRRLIREVAIEYPPVLVGAQVRFGQDLFRRELDHFFRRDPNCGGRMTDLGHVFLINAWTAYAQFAE
jgi:hypothetical protein